VRDFKVSSGLALSGKVPEIPLGSGGPKVLVKMTIGGAEHVVEIKARH